jgi:MoaA/NifB/PqqE/SkfB family radical SAM enzyme
MFERLPAVLRQLEIFVRNQLRHRLTGSDWLRPVYAIYELTWACNLDCSYCDDGAGHSYPRQVGRARPAPLAEVKRILARLRRDVPGLYLTGGEPTVHPHFLEIMREVHDLGFAPVILNTNGLRLPLLLEREPDLLERVDVLVFSLDSTDARVLDRLFQSRPGDGRRTLEALERCLLAARGTGCTVAVNCVITRDTVDDARAVAALCRERGIPFMPVPANRGKGLLVPLDDLGRLADELATQGPPPLGSPDVVDVLLRLGRFECHPSLRLHVTPDGRIPWPCQSDQRFALRILDYPSIRALLGAAEARFSVEKQGQACGSPCYLAQNVSTDVYLRRPLSMVTNVAGEFLLRRAR